MNMKNQIEVVKGLLSTIGSKNDFDVFWDKSVDRLFICSNGKCKNQKKLISSIEENLPELRFIIKETKEMIPNYASLA